jgi:hypothetical protein
MLRAQDRLSRRRMTRFDADFHLATIPAQIPPTVEDQHLWHLGSCLAV